MSALKPTIFLDRDGVLNEDKGYVFKPADLVIPPLAGRGCRAFLDAGFQLIVLTNQSGVARGYFKEADVMAFHAALACRYLDEFGVEIAGFMVCPHHPKGIVVPFNVECKCRKPGIELLEQARRNYAIDWDASALIGDKDSDIQCAINGQLTAIRLVTGQYSRNIRADYEVSNLLEAAALVNKLTLQKKET